MPIQVCCTSCGTNAALPDEAAGRVARCRRCKATFQVPRGKSTEEIVKCTAENASQHTKSAKEASGAADLGQRPELQGTGKGTGDKPPVSLVPALRNLTSRQKVMAGIPILLVFALLLVWVTARSEQAVDGARVRLGDGSGVPPAEDDPLVESGEKNARIDSATIRRNENSTLRDLDAYDEAQETYRRTDWDSDGVLEYAQSINGDNSLFEKNAGSGDLTLVDKAFAIAAAGRAVQRPKAGYYFKVLKSIRESGVSRSFVVAGSGKTANSMTLGFGILAWPAEYDKSGRHTFLGMLGTVKMKDLGPRTSEIANQFSGFDVDDSWEIAPLSNVGFETEEEETAARIRKAIREHTMPNYERFFGKLDREERELREKLRATGDQETRREIEGEIRQISTHREAAKNLQRLEADKERLREEVLDMRGKVPRIQ